MTGLTPARLRELLHADPDTGICTWLVSTGRVKVGDVAGCLNNGNGYIYIGINERLELAHRLIWLYVTGSWPSHEIDHINGEKADNRFANLREATSSQNKANRGPQSNNTSGYKGVSWHKHSRRWAAQIHKDGRRISLGYYPTPEAAHSAYVKAAHEHHGEFGRAA